MPLPPGEIELTVEREVADPTGGSPRKIRLVARLRPEPTASGTDATALVDWVAELGRVVDQAVERMAHGSSRAPRTDRSLEELVDAYHPRQVELVELLREEGELTPLEHQRLQEYLVIPTAASAAAPPPPVGRSIAEAPLERDPAPSKARPVPELLALYQIASLKQAGAVRARRQISYEEYMSVKRHFSTGDANAPR